MQLGFATPNVREFVLVSECGRNDAVSLSLQDEATVRERVIRLDTVHRSSKFMAHIIPLPNGKHP